MIDPNNHYIYQTFSGIDSGDVQNCAIPTTGPCNTHVVYMAVSTDGGKHFTDQVVYDNPNRNVSYGHQFVNVSIDKAGNVYSVYSDNHNVSYSYSTNHGTSWSAPVQVNKAPANTAIFPWSVANRAGHIDIVYYGTSYYDGTTPPDSYPSSAAWYVLMAQNVSATKSGSTFTQVQPTPIVHFGGVCDGGISCVYSDDQYTNDPNDPPASTSCTTSTTNTGSCDHTSIATQTAGTGI